jgi:C2 domain
MILTISPLFSLYEYILARRSSGPSEETRTVRLTVRNAACLQRPKCELDGLSPEYLEQISVRNQAKIRNPSPFAVVTIDKRDMFVTYDQQDEANPDWEESVDIRVGDMSTVVIRVFDLKCMDRSGWPSMIGFTIFLPLSVLVPRPQAVQSEPSDDEQQEPDGNNTVRTESVTLPLIRDGVTIPGMTVSISLSTDIESPLPPPKLPPRFQGHKQTHVSSKVGILSFRGRRLGTNKETITETYWLP